MIHRYLNPEYPGELSKSIAVEPLIVEKRGEYFKLMHGERSFTAAKVAGLEKVPCVIQETESKRYIEAHDKCPSCSDRLKPQRIGINLFDRFFLQQTDKYQRSIKNT